MERQTLSCKAFVIFIINALINLVVVSALVVFYWRGTWEILDVYVFPDNFEFTAWVSVAVGNGIIFSFSVLQNVFSFAKKLKNPVVYFVLSRLYVYILGFGCVNQWRGIWFLQDHYTGKTWQSATGSTLIGVGVLCCFRCLSGVLASPLSLMRDYDKENLFVLTTRFSTKVEISVKFVLDICLTVFLINNLVVFYWRGVWSLLDLYLYPDDIILSGAYSYVISFSLVLPVLIGQYGVKRLSKHLSSKSFILQFLLEDLFLVISGTLVVCHWRGAWLLQNGLILPENKELSVWISHIIGSIGLIMLLASRSYLAAGCYMDKEIHEGNGSIFQMNFIKVGNESKQENIDAYDSVETKTDQTQNDLETRL